MLRKIIRIIRKNDLHLWVFTTGAMILIIEIVAVRILAPYFGNTLFSVSSVLSVVLLALSIGYWVGGNLADKSPKRELFYAIILSSGILVLLLEIVRHSVLEVISRNFSITWGPLISAVILFIGPAFLLGMLSPLAIKLKSDENKDAGIGRVTGGMFFWSTLGSISGSIAAGFILIPRFGADLIMLSIGITLVIMGATPLLLRKYFTPRFTAALLVIVGSLFFGSIAVAKADVPDHVVFHTDGVYEKIIISDGEYRGRPARFLVQDRSSSGASYFDSDELVYDYTKYYSLFEAYDTTLDRALVLGGGAYSIPRALLSEESAPVVDVVEIEPSLYELSKKYFDLPDSDRMHNHIEDGRRFLKQTGNSYDLIYGDVYRSLLSIPNHFTTVEFFELAKDRLTEDGIYVMNVIGDTYRVQDSITFSEMRTFRSVFPNSRFYAARSASAPRAQNIIMVGAHGDSLEDIDYSRFVDHPNPTLAGLETREIDAGRFSLDDHKILTDDYAPVDYLVSKLFDRRNNIPPSDGNQARAIVEQLLDYGPRYSGSNGNDRAAEFISSDIQAHTDKVHIQDWEEGTSFTNIIGQIKPDLPRRVVLGTHYDSKQFADLDSYSPDQPVPGGNDSASGVATLLMLAQILDEQSDDWPFPFGIDFVFFDGEEGSMQEEQWRPVGSEYFAQNLQALYGDTKPEAAVIFDMVCERNAVFKREQNSNEAAKGLVDTFWGSGKAVGGRMFSDEQGPAILDDHTPLNAVGIPSILLIDSEYPYFHTTEDTADKCDELTLEVVIRSSLVFLVDYSNASI